MHHVIDRMLATNHDRELARLWAEYAMQNYGGGAAERLRQGFAKGAKVKSRRALRLAVRRVETNLHRKICITTLPTAAPTPVADAG